MLVRLRVRKDRGQTINGIVAFDLTGEGVYAEGNNGEGKKCSFHCVGVAKRGVLEVCCLKASNVGGTL
jgi:hypothetical protein